MIISNLKTVLFVYLLSIESDSPLEVYQLDFAVPRDGLGAMVNQCQSAMLMSRTRSIIMMEQ